MAHRDSAAWWVEEGARHEAESRFREAERAYKEALELEPEHADAKQRLERLHASGDCPSREIPALFRRMADRVRT